MYVETIPNRGSAPTILIRIAWREGKRVRKQTLANLTRLPPELIDGIKILVKGGVAVSDLGQAFEKIRSRPHGNVAAVLGTLRRIGLDKLIASRSSRKRDLVLAMIAARVLAPGSKLATVRALRERTLCDSLGEQLGLGRADEDDLYEAMDWLLKRQGAIERKIARRHLRDGCVVLCDVTATYVEGQCCSLAERGWSKDGRKDREQIVFGLLCDVEGRPMGVEVFGGKTKDSMTLAAQVKKLREGFGLCDVIVVGDRGLINTARIEEDLKPAGLSWITALRSDSISSLMVQTGFQPSLFDERNLAEITSDDYPAQRLVVCRNPFLAKRRSRIREELLCSTEKKLDKVVEAVTREKNPERGKDRIGVRVGKVINKFKVAKHFEYRIEHDSFTYSRNQQSIDKEAALDGIYVIRTDVEAQKMDSQEVVRTYKGLGKVESAFRSFKSASLKVSPIYHYRDSRVRAHVFLCMLAYYVEWHMRRCLAPMLFAEHDPEQAERRRDSVVCPARKSRGAEEKAKKKRTEDGLAVHSFKSLLKDLATVTKDRVRPKTGDHGEFDMISPMTPLQRKAFDLLGVKL